MYIRYNATGVYRSIHKCTYGITLQGGVTICRLVTQITQEYKGEYQLKMRNTNTCEKYDSYMLSVLIRVSASYCTYF